MILKKVLPRLPKRENRILNSQPFFFLPFRPACRCASPLLGTVALSCETCQTSILLFYNKKSSRHDNHSTEFGCLGMHIGICQGLEKSHIFVLLLKYLLLI